MVLGSRGLVYRKEEKQREREAYFYVYIYTRAKEREREREHCPSPSSEFLAARQFRAAEKSSHTPKHPCRSKRERERERKRGIGGGAVDCSGIFATAML